MRRRTKTGPHSASPSLWLGPQRAFASSVLAMRLVDFALSSRRVVTGLKVCHDFTAHCREFLAEALHGRRVDRLLAITAVTDRSHILASPLARRRRALVLCGSAGPTQ